MQNKNYLTKIAVLITVTCICCVIIILLISKSEKDVRPYIYINEQIKYAQNNQHKNLYEKHNSALISGMKFQGVNYLQNNGSLIIIINKPMQAGFFISNVHGGQCYKLFGSLSLRGFLSETRKICSYNNK